MTRLRFLLLFLLSAAVANACGNGDDDSDDPTAPTCQSICERQNELCGESDNCAGLCSGIADFNSRNGCTAEFQEGLDCLAEKDQCDADSTICPASSFDACVEAFCTQNPNDPNC